MAKIKYYYDTETCRYERIKTTTSDIVINAVGLLFICLIFGAGFALIHDKYFPSQQERQLMRENQDLEFSYNLIKKEIEGVKKELMALQDRDENIYRVLFEAEPIPLEIRNAATGGSQKYQNLLDNIAYREELIVTTLSKIDNLKRQMYIQSTSYDEISNLASNKTKLWASIPAIQPIPDKNLKRFASGYGMRLHPIHKVRKMHYGCDFSAPRGTPIYATGDGVVEKVKKLYGGYGKHIIVNHGFGYKTLYAHMSSFSVKKGSKIKRGQKIGEVGNTGLSVAPHLHYEVHYNGRKVNPVHYFHNDLTPTQYDNLLKKASQDTQSLGGGY